MEEIEKNNVNCSNLQYDLSTESQPSKKEVVDFVETVLEMEIQAYTLLEMGNACVSKAKMFEKEVYKDEPRQKMWSAEKELREAKDNLKLLEVKKKDRIREAKGYFIANVAKAFVIGYIILLLALSLTLSIFDSFSDVFATNHEVSEDFLSAIIYILALMIGGFIVNIFKKKRVKIAKREANKDINNAKKRLQQLEIYLEVAKNEYEKSRKKMVNLREGASELIKQNSECLAQSRKVRKMIDEFHEKFSIIPPDYRHIDCVIIISHAFRNGLADNMRDAVLYYEQREFRNKVIRGIDNVQSMLGQLASSVHDVAQVLNRIDCSVKRIANAQEANETVNLARKQAEEAFFASQKAHNAYVERQIWVNS